MAGKIRRTAASKTALRKEIIAARDALTADRRYAFSASITTKLLALDAYRAARCVLAYMSFGSEFSTSTFVDDALASGKQLCLPRVRRETREMELRHVTNISRDLEDGIWNIPEPHTDCPLADIDDIDFVLLPGVAFTARCDRLGYGGGFYDRLINRFRSRPPLVAAAFALQLREDVPLDAHDEPIDVVITEDALHCRC